MNITRADAARLLSLCSTWDNRNVTEVAAAAWCESGNLGRWSYAEACAAIKDYYTYTQDPKPWCMPSHITAFIRAHRQDQALRDEGASLTAIEGPRTAQESARAKAIAQFAKAFAEKKIPNGDADLKAVDAEVVAYETRRLALRVKCPYCRAEPFKDCTAGSHRMSAPHPSRVEAAAEAEREAS